MRILGAIEPGGNVRLQTEEKPATKENIRAFFKPRLAEETKIICTDQHKGDQGLTDDNTIYVTLDYTKTNTFAAWPIRT